MQNLNWNDLRYLLAVRRAGSLSAAARLMGVDDTTVSRRLAALQRALGEELVFRQPGGKLVLTDHGASAARRIEAMEREADGLCELHSANPGQCTGTVRITSVPFLVNRWLAPQLGDLLAAHPELQVDLIPDSRDFSLTQREADIALRFARPTAGGSDVLARRIGSLTFSIFAARSSDSGDGAGLPWILYDDSMAHLPQAKWLAGKSKQAGERVAGLKVHDIETAMEAVAAGIGKSLLPTSIGDGNEALQRLDAGPISVSREVWLLSHRNQRSLRRMTVVGNWIAGLFADSP